MSGRDEKGLPTSGRSQESGGRGRIRVLFVTDVDLSGPSGQNVATRELVDALAHHDGVELWVACPRSDDPSLGRLWEAVSMTFFLPRKRTRSVLWGLAAQVALFRHLWMALRSHSVDVVVARRGPSLLLPPLFARAFQIRYVLLQRGMRSNDERSLQDRMLSAPMRLVGLANIRCADEVFVAYGEVKELIDKDRTPDQKQATILPNAVDPDKFGRISINEARSRLSGLDLNERDEVIGFAGSFQPKHGVDLMIRSLARIRSSHSHAKLLAVGEGPMRKSLAALARELGVDKAVIFTGMVPHDEVGLHMAACDVLTAVVDRERPSNPIKVYEYLASERPVVVSECPEFAFIERESLGRLVRSNDERHFGEALLEVLELPSSQRTRMGKLGRSYVERHHTWEQFAAAILRI